MYRNDGLGIMPRQLSQPGLGGLFEALQSVAQKVGNVASQVQYASGELSKVSSGQASLATVPKDRAYISIPIPGSPVAQAVPLLPLAIGGGLLLYMALRKR